MSAPTDITNEQRALEWKDLGNARLREGHDYRGAEEAYSAAITLVPSNYIFYNNRACARIMARRFEEAIQDCDSSLSIQENVRAYSRKATALCELGRVEEAMKCTEMGLLICPDDKQSLNISAGLKEMKLQAEELKQKGNEVFRESRDFHGAIKAYTAAISLVKSNYVYYNNRAAAYIFGEQYDKAISDCNISLGIKENVRAYSRKAAALGELGRVDEALDCLKKGLNLEPEDKQSLNLVTGLREIKKQAEEHKKSGIVKMRRNKDFVGAIQEFSEAIAMIKTNFAYYNNRAAAFLFNGNLQKAVDDCETSLLITESVRAYIWKASALSEMGMIDKAFDAISSALRIDPSDKMALDVEKKLIKLKVLLDAESEKKSSLGGKASGKPSQDSDSKKGFLRGLKNIGHKKKNVYEDRVQEEDKEVLEVLEKSRKYRLKIKHLQEEKDFMHLCFQEEKYLQYSLVHARKTRKERMLEYRYQQRVLSEDAGVLCILQGARKHRQHRRMSCEEAALLSQQEHARDFRKWKRIVDMLSAKAKAAREDKENKRDSARYIKEQIKLRKKEVSLKNCKPQIPEHLLPFSEKVALWSDQIRKQLRRDWVGMHFSIEYIENEGLCIGFDIENEIEMEEQNLDFKIARYMNRLAINGILHDKKLCKRPDKWRQLEVANDGRGMSLRFYLHMPRTNEALLKMPRDSEMDIIERGHILTRDHSNSKVIKPLHAEGAVKPKVRMKKSPQRAADMVHLPSVEIEVVRPGFIRMVENRNDSSKTFKRQIVVNKMHKKKRSKVQL